MAGPGAPPLLHLVGAHETNAPWGFENRILDACARLGLEVVATDYRKHRDRIHEVLATPASITLVCKGEGIPPDAIARAPGISVLWYAEQLGTPLDTDDLAETRRAELAANAHAFDAVFLHDQGMLPVAARLGAAPVAWAATACVDPLVHRPLAGLPRREVVFVGARTPRRERLLTALAPRSPPAVVEVWDPVAQNEVFARSRIVLNLHLSDLDNTETRVAEVLGAGSCLVTETLSSPDLVTDGEHVAMVPTGDVDAIVNRVEDLLHHEEARARLARNGHRHVMAHHTLDGRLTELLRTATGLHRDRDTWPRELGILHDREGDPTTSIEAFRSAVAAIGGRGS